MAGIGTVRRTGKGIAILSRALPACRASECDEVDDSFYMLVWHR